jgi:hypothetical protein
MPTLNEEMSEQDEILVFGLVGRVQEDDLAEVPHVEKVEH